MKPRLMRIRMTGREKFGEGKKELMIQKKPTTPVEHGGSVKAWVCVADNATGLILFINDVIAVGSSRMNWEV